MKVIALIGGISQNSLNKQLYSELLRLNTTSFTFETFDISALPFFSQDLENTPPAVAAEFQHAVRNADAVLFITPEYNRSFPGVLKNAIDWATRPYGQNLWQHKPAAIIGASMGRIGTFGAQQHLKSVCSFLDMRLMNQPELYFDASASMNEKGNIKEESVGFVQKYLKAFESWIKG
ncbi:FMN reductase [Bacteroidia bacterium]|nr:FMN reductase [Bacteroidia bacterium]